MAKNAHARRYAQAVFELAVEAGDLDRWETDLVKIAVLGEDPEVPALLENPRLKLEDKARVIGGALPDVRQLGLNLVYMLVARGNLGLCREIADEYIRMLDEHRGVQRAEVVTAVPLDEDDRKHLEERLGAVVGKKVIVNAGVDPELLGGIVARMGGKLLDGSVRSRLAALKNEIAKVPR